jgi:hypothetical protein
MSNNAITPLPATLPLEAWAHLAQSGIVRGMARAATLAPVCLLLATASPGDALRKECSFRPSKP